MAGICAYCNVDTGGNHELNCPFHPNNIREAIVVPAEDSKVRYGPTKLNYNPQKEIEQLKQQLTEAKAEIGMLKMSFKPEGCVDINKLNSKISEQAKEVEQMLNMLKRVYQKHHCGNEDIGWEELSSELCDTLCNIMGSDKFIEWAKLTRADQMEYMTNEEIEQALDKLDKQEEDKLRKKE
jgi:hypothetical protein